VFSASAIHWIDEPRSAGDQQALRSSLARIAPELAAEWPSYRDLDAMLQGAVQRRGNVSETWAWLGSYAVARGYVFDLFEDAQLATMPMLVEQTADALNAVLGTMSFWARMSSGQRDALCAEHHALHERLGRPIRSSMVACWSRREGRSAPDGVGSGAGRRQPAMSTHRAKTTQRVAGSLHSSAIPPHG
jgi:hypothetical protein